jgi:antitoxin VapB
MAMNIKSAEAEALARRVAALTGETLTAAILNSLRDRLARLDASSSGEALADELDAIALRAAALPVLDPRSPDEILGYDEKGLPR